MPRYIDADLMTADIQRYLCASCSIHCNPSSFKNSACEIAECLRMIDTAPTADVQEVKHGRWIECDYKRLEHGMIETYPNAGYACSVCRTGFDKKKMTYKQYCPHCGAEMDESGGE